MKNENDIEEKDIEEKTINLKKKKRKKRKTNRILNKLENSKFLNPLGVILFPILLITAVGLIMLTVFLTIFPFFMGNVEDMVGIMSLFLGIGLFTGISMLVVSVLGIVGIISITVCNILILIASIRQIQNNNNRVTGIISIILLIFTTSYLKIISWVLDFF